MSVDVTLNSEELKVKTNWSILLMKQSYSTRHQCHILNYEADSVTCNYINNCKSIITIDCVALNIYPRPICYLHWENENLTTDDYTMLNQNFTYSHSQMNTSINQFNSSCSIEIPYSYLNNEEMNITVTMYPNVTGRDSDKAHGQNVTLILEIDDLRLALENCSNKMTHNDVITCTCKADGCDVDQSTLHWTNVSDSSVMNNRSATLNVLLSDGHIEAFMCTAKHRKTNATVCVYFNITELSNIGDENRSITAVIDNVTKTVGLPSSSDAALDLSKYNSGNTARDLVIVSSVLGFGFLLLLAVLLRNKADCHFLSCHKERNFNKYKRLSNVGEALCVNSEVEIDNSDIYELQKTRSNPYDHYSTIRSSLVLTNKEEEPRSPHPIIPSRDIYHAPSVKEDTYARISDNYSFPSNDLQPAQNSSTATLVELDPYTTLEEATQCLIPAESSPEAPQRCLPRKTINNCLYTQVFKPDNLSSTLSTSDSHHKESRVNNETVILHYMPEIE